MMALAQLPFLLGAILAAVVLTREAIRLRRRPALTIHVLELTGAAEDELDGTD